MSLGGSNRAVNGGRSNRYTRSAPTGVRRCSRSDCPPDIEERLDRLAKTTGRTKSFYAREAILEHLGELEDLYIAEQRLIENRAGRSRTYTLEEVERERCPPL